MKETAQDLPDTISEYIKNYLRSLNESLHEYSTNLHNKQNCWIHNLFKFMKITMELAASDYESLIELTSDSVLKAKLAKVTIAFLWGSLIEEYENLSKKVPQALLPFTSTCLSESGFLDVRKGKPSIAPDWTLDQI